MKISSVGLGGPYNPMLRSPVFGQRMFDLLHYLRWETSVPLKLNEFAILIIGRQWRSQVEWFAHAPLAIKAGLSPDIVTELKANKRPSNMPPQEAVVYDFVTELTTKHQSRTRPSIAPGNFSANSRSSTWRRLPAPMWPWRCSWLWPSKPCHPARKSRSSRANPKPSIGGARPRCLKLRIGSRNSVCPSTPSVLPKTTSTPPFSLDLTDQDFKELGVSLGHRRKMLAAIAEFTGAAPAGSPQPTLTEAKPRGSAERRQVTVMFSDLVGSTALSTRMDPEDLREVISAYQKCVADTVRRFGGFVAKYMGDGVLVYFGYPQAHEDDAERAVRTGLEFIARGERTRFTGRPTNPCRHCHRIGRGRRFDRIGRGAGARHRRRDAKLGGAPARHRRAKHGGHRRAHKQTSWQFVRVARPRGKRDQRDYWASAGIGGPAGGAVESRFEALHAGGLTALVGREEEFELAASPLGTSKDAAKVKWCCSPARPASANRG